MGPLRRQSALQNLRTGLCVIGPSESIGESHRDGYELTSLDISDHRSEPQAASSCSPSPSAAGHTENGGFHDTATESGPPINGFNSPQPHRSRLSSEETTTNGGCSRAEVWKDIWLPLFCIDGSMLLVLITLAALVSIFRVEPEKGLFFAPTGFNLSKQEAYILLSIPASMEPLSYDS